MKIGIIAGMGAAAGAHFYSALVSHCQKLGCVKDSDFPEVFLHSVPFKSSSATGIDDDEAMRIEITSAIKNMEKFQPDKIIMACNSLHKSISELRTMTVAEIVSLPESALKQCQNMKIGVICSESSMRDNVYPSSALYPDEYEQKLANGIIETAMRAHSPFEAMNARLILASLVDKLIKRGAERVILGCTELPIFGMTDKNVIDPGLCAIEDALK